MKRRPLPPQLAAVLARLGAQAARMRADALDLEAARLRGVVPTMDLTREAVAIDELPDLTRFAEMIG